MQNKQDLKEAFAAGFVDDLEASNDRPYEETTTASLFTIENKGDVRDRLALSGEEAKAACPICYSLMARCRGRDLVVARKTLQYVLTELKTQHHNSLPTIHDRKWIIHDLERLLAQL